MAGDENQGPAAPAVQGTTKGKDASADDKKAGAINWAIQEWMRQHIHNSPVSRATPALNHLQSKLPELAALLMKEV